MRYRPTSNTSAPPILLLTTAAFETVLVLRGRKWRESLFVRNGREDAARLAVPSRHVLGVSEGAHWAIFGVSALLAARLAVPRILEITYLLIALPVTYILFPELYTSLHEPIPDFDYGAHYASLVLEGTITLAFAAVATISRIYLTALARSGSRTPPLLQARVHLPLLVTGMMIPIAVPALNSADRALLRTLLAFVSSKKALLTPVRGIH